MAKWNKRKKAKKRWSIKNTIIAVAATLGISIGGCGTDGMLSAEKEKQLEKDADDLNKLNIESIDESEIEPTIEEEIKDSIDEEISFDDEQIEIVQEEIEEVSEKIVEIGGKYLKEIKTKSLDNAKDKKTTITSYSLDDLVIPIIRNFETVSVVDALNEVGYDSSISSRAKLAVYFNIVSNEEEFEGLDYQNTQLLEALRQYARNLQNSAYNDYAPVIDNKTIENSVPDISNSENVDNPDSGQSDNANNKDDKKDKDKDKDKDKKHKHKWGDWIGINDEDEERECSKCGEIETQKHPSYGEWQDNGDDTKSRTCDNCGYTMTQDYVWGAWTAIDDEEEYREREDGKREEQPHPYGEWIDNGDNTESKTCPNCNHTLTRDKEPEHEHHCEEQAPVSLEAKDEENCMVVKYICPEDDYEDESLRRYLPHDLEDEPITVIGDEGLFECKNCGIQVVKKIEKPEHEHHCEEQEPVSLEAKDEENCMVVKYICPEDDYEDESLRRYLPHDLEDTPIVVIGNEGLFECKNCGIQIIKEIVNSKPDEIAIDFGVPLEENNDYYEEEKEMEQDLPAVTELPTVVEELDISEEEKKEEQIEQEDSVLLLEDKSSKLLLEDKQYKQNDLLTVFNPNVYKKLFKEKVILEQGLTTCSEKEKETRLRLIKNIDALKANMVQELANALVQKELQRVEEGKPNELIFKA